jgi:hypothetical protein
VPALNLKLNGVNAPNVKAFGAKDVDQIVVMLLNQNQGGLPVPYTVRLDLAPILSNNALKVNMGAGVSREYSNLPYGELAPESTVMLVFNASGTLRARHVYSVNNAAAPPIVYSE